MHSIYGLFFAGIVFATTVPNIPTPEKVVLLGEEQAPTTIEYPVEKNALVASSETMVVSAPILIERYFGSVAATFKEIARCESATRQFRDDGSLVRGIAVHEDVGILQVNETYHLEEAKKRGFDIYTLEGNLAFGKWLYDRDGLSPWSASRGCWDR